MISEMLAFSGTEDRHFTQVFGTSPLGVLTPAVADRRSLRSPV